MCFDSFGGFPSACKSPGHHKLRERVLWLTLEWSYKNCLCRSLACVGLLLTTPTFARTRLKYYSLSPVSWSPNPVTNVRLKQPVTTPNNEMILTNCTLFAYIKTFSVSASWQNLYYYYCFVVVLLRNALIICFCFQFVTFMQSLNNKQMPSKSCGSLFVTVLEWGHKAIFEST